MDHECPVCIHVYVYMYTLLYIYYMPSLEQRPCLNRICAYFQALPGPLVFSKDERPWVSEEVKTLYLFRDPSGCRSTSTAPPAPPAAELSPRNATSAGGDASSLLIGPGPSPSPAAPGTPTASLPLSLPRHPSLLLFLSSSLLSAPTLLFALTLLSGLALLSALTLLPGLTLPSPLPLRVGSEIAPSFCAVTGSCPAGCWPLASG